MLSFFKTIISLPSFFSLRATHHTSRSTKSIREIFFIFLVQNRFVSNPAAPAFFFPFVPIAIVKYSICSINLYSSHIVNPCIYFSTYFTIQTCYSSRKYNMTILESKNGNSKLNSANFQSSTLNNLIRFVINLFSHLISGQILVLRSSYC